MRQQEIIQFDGSVLGSVTSMCISALLIIFLFNVRDGVYIYMVVFLVCVSVLWCYLHVDCIQVNAILYLMV